MRLRLFDRVLLSSAALAVILFCSAGRADARLGEHWSKTRQEPFMLFFAIDSATKFSDGKVTLHPWAKRFAKDIQLQVTLGADSVVTGLELMLDRASLESDWMNMRDIAKNLLREQIDAHDTLAIDTLANEIEFVLDRGVFYAGGVPPLPATPTEVYQVFLEKKEDKTEKLSHTKLTLRNTERAEKKVLVITMSEESLAGPR
jgi:hypothetical protein